MDWCFLHLDIQGIYGECDAANPRSARVMLKAGMVEEFAPGHEGERRFAMSRKQWNTTRDDPRP